MAAAAVLRVWLEQGHGASNSRPGRFDPGASSCYGSEADIVAGIVSEALYRFFQSPDLTIDVAEVPQCNSICLSRHPRSSHLGFKITYLNERLKRRPDGRTLGEVLVSLHMNSAEYESATGVEVLYSHSIAARRRTAAEISRVVAAKLGLPDRGAKSDRESARGKLAILNRTECPAYLIEMGFVTNGGDVQAVKSCGVDALVAALEIIEKEHGR